MKEEKLNWIMNPAEIERESMRIIERELAERGITLPEENAAVIRRVIHTTADFDYAGNLYFTRGAVPAAEAALRRGITIVTDTNMARAGISRSGLRELGGEVICYMAEEETARQAKERGVTRAVISVERACREQKDCLFAVGNAPTALLELASRIEEGARPALVIGVPVGFVNVVEAKERIRDVCVKYGVPAILAMGRKGGSSVAAAICNALIYEAADMLDPGSR